MKNYIFAIMMVVVLLCAACGRGLGEGAVPSPSIIPKSESEAIPEGAIEFELINATGGDIYEIYVSKAEVLEYGEDLLKERIVKADDSIKIYFMPIENVQYYDLKVLREDGDYYTWLNVPMGTFGKINLTIGDEGPVFTVE